MSAGKKVEVILWTLIAASIVLALGWRGTLPGTVGIVTGGVSLGLWVVWLLVASPYRQAGVAPGADAGELVRRLRAARAGGPPLSGEDRVALQQLAARSRLDASVEKEILDALSRGPERATDLALAIELLATSSAALGALLQVLPGLTASEAPRVAAAIARDQGLVARATPILLGDEALLGSFARALADALANDSALGIDPSPDLARALGKALERDPARRATLEARMR
jgi:hypothetical protein